MHILVPDILFLNALSSSISLHPALGLHGLPDVLKSDGNFGPVEKNNVADGGGIDGEEGEVHNGVGG